MGSLGLLWPWNGGSLESGKKKQKKTRLARNGPFLRSYRKTDYAVLIIYGKSLVYIAIIITYIGEVISLVLDHPWVA